MKASLKILLLLVIYMWSALVLADDTDIYLDTDAARANPPYLMLYIDYRPSVVSTFCNGLKACVPKMSENAFVKLCSLYGGAPEGVCRTYYQDVQSGGTLTSQGI